MRAATGRPIAACEAVGYASVAEEIVAVLVGSIGLVAAVPVTTALAAVIATRVPPSQLPRERHAH